jgi:hypothetical protein
MTNQSKAWRQIFYAVYSGNDAEQDSADDEPALGSPEPSTFSRVTNAPQRSKRLGNL